MDARDLSAESAPSMPRHILVFAILLLSSEAAAESRPRVVTTRAAAIEPEALAPLLGRGELALVESEGDGSSRQVVIFSAISAPPDRVYDAIVDVESYPKFMGSVVRSEIVKRQRDMIAYEWELDLPVFNLKGTKALRGQRPHLVEARGVSGNFKESRERTELYPLEGGKKTLAVFYRAIDVASAGMLIKTMIKMEPTMEHGASLAAGFVHLRDIKRHVEGLPPPRSSHSEGAAVPAFRRLDSGAALAPVEKLLPFGTVALIESNDDGSLRQVVLFADVAAPQDRVHQVITTPERYPEFLPNLVEQKVKHLSDRKLELEYEIDVPLANLEGTTVMEIEEGGGVEVVATGGDITRGRWRWELAPRNGHTVPVHYAYSDVRETSFVVRKLIEQQPMFEHGIVVAASTVAILGIKARAEGKR
jgi:ribosome-associated toxin RatA of RatAB toxin-antitoxin module